MDYFTLKLTISLTFSYIFVSTYCLPPVSFQLYTTPHLCYISALHSFLHTTTSFFILHTLHIPTTPFVPCSVVPKLYATYVVYQLHILAPMSVASFLHKHSLRTMFLMPSPQMNPTGTANKFYPRSSTCTNTLCPLLRVYVTFFYKHHPENDVQYLHSHIMDYFTLKLTISLTFSYIFVSSKLTCTLPYYS
uniref:Uncharacterized protein n=1 Tax=Trichuris muris TaxID=70415 RepID=A0A5S6QV00_TRIMR